MKSLLPAKITHSDDDCGASVRIELHCGRIMEFGTQYIQKDSREWLAGVIQRQVNEIVARECHAAVELHKRKLKELTEPTHFNSYVIDKMLGPDLLLKHIEMNFAITDSSSYGQKTWSLGGHEIKGMDFRSALQLSIPKVTT